MVGKRAALAGLALALTAGALRAEEPNWHSSAAQPIVHLGIPASATAGSAIERTPKIVVRAKNQDEKPAEAPTVVHEAQPANSVYFADVNPWTGMPWTARYGDYDPNQVPPVWEEAHPWLAPLHRFYGDVEILG